MKSDPNKSRAYVLGKQLIQAIQENNIVLFNSLMEEPALNPNYEHSRGLSDTPIVIAMRLLREDMFERLLQHPRVILNSLGIILTDINYFSTHSAADDMDKIVSMCVKLIRDPRVNVKNKNMFELFKICTRLNITAVLSTLVERPEFSSSLGRALTFAIWTQRKDVVALLLARPDIDLYQRDYHGDGGGYTPVELACYIGNSDIVDMLRICLKSDPTKKTPTDLYAQLKKAIEMGSYKLFIKTIHQLKYGNYPLSPANTDWDPLHSIVVFDREKMLKKWLFEPSINVSKKNKYGVDALGLAAVLQKKNVLLRLLRDPRADVNTTLVFDSSTGIQGTLVPTLTDIAGADFARTHIQQIASLQLADLNPDPPSYTYKHVSLAYLICRFEAEVWDALMARPEFDINLNDPLSRAIKTGNDSLVQKLLANPRIYVSAECLDNAVKLDQLGLALQLIEHPSMQLVDFMGIFARLCFVNSDIAQVCISKLAECGFFLAYNDHGAHDSLGNLYPGPLLNAMDLPGLERLQMILASPDVDIKRWGLPSVLTIAAGRGLVAVVDYLLTIPATKSIYTIPEAFNLALRVGHHRIIQRLFSELVNDALNDWPGAQAGLTELYATFPRPPRTILSRLFSTFISYIPFLSSQLPAEFDELFSNMTAIDLHRVALTGYDTLPYLERRYADLPDDSEAGDLEYRRELEWHISKLIAGERVTLAELLARCEPVLELNGSDSYVTMTVSLGGIPGAGVGAVAGPSYTPEAAMTARLDIESADSCEGALGACMSA